MTQANNFSQETAWETCVKTLDPSLMPLIFRYLDANNQPFLREFSHNGLPMTASVLCKFSALLVLTLWTRQKSSNQDGEIPKQLDDVLTQVWVGHQRFNEGLAASVLHEASVVSESNFLASEVKNPTVFRKWGRLFNLRRGPYREFLRAFESENWFKWFVSFIDSLPILSHVKFENDSFVFGSHTQPSFPFFYRNSKFSTPMYFQCFQNSETPTIVFEEPYTIKTEELEVSSNHDYYETYIAFRKLLGLEHIQEGIVHLFGSDYDYIKNLAIAVIEADSSAARLAYNNLVQHFKNYDDQVDPEKRPLDFVTLLIAEHGPTKIVEMLIKQGGCALVYDYIQVLENRGHGTLEYWKNEIARHISNRNQKIEAYLNLHHEFKNDLCYCIEKDAFVWGLLKSAGLDIKAPRGYVESLELRTKMLQDWREAYRAGQCDKDSLVIRYNKLIERTFRFLICFYHALGEINKSRDTWNRNYESMEKFFLKAGQNKQSQISRLSAGALVAAFRELLKNNNIQHATDSLLGRISICNREQFNKITQDPWISVVNTEKHDKMVALTEKDILEFADRTISLFRFLSGSEAALSSSIEPVYPMVISFHEANRKRDGILIYSYQIYSIGDKPGHKRMHILTPFEYQPNEEYYCIPSYNKSTRFWWLEPFLLRCDHFDQIFEQNIGSENSN